MILKNKNYNAFYADLFCRKTRLRSAEGVMKQPSKKRKLSKGSQEQLDQDRCLVRRWLCGLSSQRVLSQSILTVTRYPRLGYLWEVPSQLIALEGQEIWRRLLLGLAKRPVADSFTMAQVAVEDPCDERVNRRPGRVQAVTCVKPSLTGTCSLWESNINSFWEWCPDKLLALLWVWPLQSSTTSVPPHWD